MKVYLKTIWNDDVRPLWACRDQRDALRKALNDEGFHAITGIGDSIEVHIIVADDDPIDIKIAKKVLDKFQKTWYAIIKRKEAL